MEINFNKIIDESVKRGLIDYSFGFEYRAVTNLLDLLIASRLSDERADVLNYATRDEKEMGRLLRHEDFKILFFAIGGIIRYEDPKVDKCRQEILAGQLITILG